MIPRYTLPEMAQIWSDANRFAIWLRIELLATEAWSRRGAVPRSALATIRRRAKVNLPRIAEIEAETRHDVTAFLTSLTSLIGPAGRYLHMGMTSSDVVDTALACQLVAALDLIRKKLRVLRRVLRRLAIRHRRTVMIGRTHGIHAEPTTFGLKAALWYAEMGRHEARCAELRRRIAIGKISGAVGTYAHSPPAIEAFVLRRLGLTPEPVATQVVQRDRHAEYFSVLALLAASMEKIAVEIRHLQRTEVLEVEEPFTQGQKGSSAMPHKRNPILSENLTGLARLVRHYAGAAMEDVALWHERDIAHSSVERVIGPDATIAVDFMLHRLCGLLDGLQVYPRRMQANLSLTGGLIFSQQVLLALVAAGSTREAAYRLVQGHAMRAWRGGLRFQDAVAADPLVRRYLAPAAVVACFNPARHVRYVDLLFRRVFKGGGEGRGARER